MGGTLSCLASGSGHATCGDYLAFLAGDQDYELTLYGVRRTKDAVERATRRNEARLQLMVAQHESACATLETEAADSLGTALRQRDIALHAPGGIKGIAAQSALTAARVALIQLTRQRRLLQHQYTRLEHGRAALDAIRARSALQDDLQYFESMRVSLDEARVPHEQLAHMQAAAAQTLQQFAQLDGQNVQYNTIMGSLGSSLIDVGAKSASEHFGDFNLGDTDSLLAALDTLRTDSHHTTTQKLDALDSLPAPLSTPVQRHSADGGGGGTVVAAATQTHQSKK